MDPATANGRDLIGKTVETEYNGITKRGTVKVVEDNERRRWIKFVGESGPMFQADPDRREVRIISEPEYDRTVEVEGGEYR